MPIKPAYGEILEALNKSSYGELVNAEPTPVVQISADYGEIDLTRTTQVDTGTISVENSMYVVRTGTSLDGLAGILSRRNIRFKPGQDVDARFSAIFEGSDEPGFEFAGLITSENMYIFGQFFGTFGVIRLFNGVNEAYHLTVTTPAAGIEVAVITIDNIVHNVNLTPGTVEHNAFEIATQLNILEPSHLFGSNGDTVTLQSVISNNKQLYDFTSATCVANYTLLVNGESPEFDFIPQENWNIDTRLHGDTQTRLDITKLNEYRIVYNGGVEFYVRDTRSGNQALVHKIRYNNLNDTPIISNSTFNIGWLVQSNDSIISRELRGGYASAHITGQAIRLIPNVSKTASQSAIGLVNTTVLVMRNRIHFKGHVNRIEVFPLIFKVSTQSMQVAFFELLLNPTFLGDLDYSFHDEETSVVEFATDAVLVVGGTNVGSAIATAGAPGDIMKNQTKHRDLVLTEGDVLAVVARVSQGAASSMQAISDSQADI